LRESSGTAAPSPKLYFLDPPRALVVDAAGYAHERPADAHPLAMPTAAREPDGVLRVDVLEALEVRRPDLRALLAHLRDEDTLACVVVTHDGDPEALLMVPAGTRSTPLSLEEARALRALADRIAGLCASRGSLARSMDRERAAQRHAEELEGALHRLEHEASLDVAREALAAGRLARPATVAIYSAASRMAYEGIERRTRTGAPFVVFAPAGVDPVPYVARAHLAGLRADGPLVIVDGTLAREHELERWRAPATSPLALAHRGLLVLLDGAVLPTEVQSLIGHALAEKRAPWERPEPLDIALALTSAWDRPRLEQALDPTLAARFGDALDVAVVVPAIRDRAEDIRSLVTDRLAREGLRLRRRPLGIEDAAFARLVDHPFEGGDAELASIVLRLVMGCEGDVVRAVDVDRLALAPVRPAPPGPTPANVRPIRR
jgi:transcriptional regulator of acetoin/glycerol metabolism